MLDTVLAKKRPIGYPIKKPYSLFPVLSFRIKEIGHPIVFKRVGGSEDYSRASSRVICGRREDFPFGDRVNDTN